MAKVFDVLGTKSGTFLSVSTANYRLRRLAMYQRAGTYCVRIVVPKSLRSVMGKTELKKSLGTKDLNRAKLLAPNRRQIQSNN